MKKILSCFLTLCMLLSVAAPILAIAEPSSAAHTFWVTHYNDGKVEGSGVIFTQEDTAGEWWIHVAFAPIEGVENAYEIVDMTNGVVDGLATSVAVPAGGFVWASNYGNDYINLGIGDTDFTNANCAEAIQYAFGWEIGDQFVIEGIDFESVPTATPDLLWYDDAYVCTSTIAPYGDAKEEHFQRRVNANEWEILADGAGEVWGDWSEIQASDVLLVNNTQCTKRGMDVTVESALGELRTIDSYTLYLYHCALWMIGYPEGQILLEVSTDGETYHEVGSFDLTPADLSLSTNGTVKTHCSFDAVEAAYVRATLFVGNNRAVLGDTPSDGKCFWEFIAITEVEIGKASESDAPVIEAGNLAAGKTYTTVGLYPNSNAPTYPDEGGLTLTDGVVSPTETGYHDPVWVGFNAQSEEYSMFEGASVVIDLGAIKVLDQGVIHAYKQSSGGITIPYGVTFSVSENGKYYKEVGCVEIDPDEISEGTYDIVCDFYTEASGRYVKINLFLYGWGFVSEIGLFYNGGDKPDSTNNLALGKDVLHAEINNENKNYCADLTDGIASDVLSYDSEWFGFYYDMGLTNEENSALGSNSAYGLATPAIDLGKTCKLDRMRVNMFLGNADGIAAPYVIYAEVSDDGLTYSQVGAVEFASASVGDQTVGWVEFDVRAGIEARYVRFHLSHRLNWLFLNEIEVYGEACQTNVACGDVNGDGEINGKDATRLLQYLANYNYADGTSKVEIASADVTGDGIVDGRDSIRLLRYLANLDPATGESSVTLGK